jgi:hypothetical protein
MIAVKIRACALLWPLFLISCREHQNPEASAHVSPIEEKAVKVDPGIKPSNSRFIFPPSSGTFVASSVALDTQTGQLCKTYEWKQSGIGADLPLCSSLAQYGLQELHVRKYNPETRTLEPAFDPFDPLELYTRTDKAKMTLTEAQIRKAASKYGLSYEEAAKGARESGYQVSSQAFNWENYPKAK